MAEGLISVRSAIGGHSASPRSVGTAQDVPDRDQRRGQHTLEAIAVRTVFEVEQHPDLNQRAAQAIGRDRAYGLGEQDQARSRCPLARS